MLWSLFIKYESFQYGYVVSFYVVAVFSRNTKIPIENNVYLILFYVAVVLINTKIPVSLVKAIDINIIKKNLWTVMRAGGLAL
jgi:hypothetical protein